MKQLSIEEKAKRYDEAIERAKNTIEVNQTIPDIVECVESLFPELKESEGERIRKEMIFYFQEEIPQCSIQEHSDKMREFISWLKRQEVERTKLELKAGSSYFCYKSRYERADNETFKKGLIYKCNKDGVLDNFVIKNPEQHFIEIKDERIAWLEKQKTIDVLDEEEREFADNVDSYRKEIDAAYQKGFDEGVKTTLEKQGEQKEINLVEILKHYPRETELYSPLYGKLWLAEIDEKCEIITCYKHPLDEGCTRAILEQEDTVSFYSNGTTGLPDFSVSKDCMLFLYDVKKQGEPKPANKVEPKFKVKYAGSEYNVLEVRDIAGVTYYGIEDEPNHIDYVKAENCEIISGYAIKENGSPYPTKPAMFSEQKPAWSEEDEKMINFIVKLLPAQPLSCKWLKSLKDRVQPKQEWSEEDERMYRGLHNLIYSTPYCDSRKELSDWLKSLKVRYTWKPSDEQMERLKGTINSLPHQGVLYSLYQDLKKLKA